MHYFQIHTTNLGYGAANSEFRPFVAIALSLRFT